MKTLVQFISSAVGAYQNCVKSGNREWQLKHLETLERLSALLPSGSGFNNGTELDIDRSSIEKLVFKTTFHHMSDHGFYEGWSEHTITITPAFDGFNLKVSGSDRNQIKDYIADVFLHCLSQEIGV